MSKMVRINLADCSQTVADLLTNSTTGDVIVMSPPPLTVGFEFPPQIDTDSPAAREKIMDRLAQFFGDER